MPEPAPISQQSLSGRQVLVTGGAGFIGSHLVERLLDLGTKVRVLDNFSSGLLANLEQNHAHLEIVSGDVCNTGTCQQVMQDVQVVVHLAAVTSVDFSLQQPAETYRVNVVGTANVFQAARDAGIGRIVYASSSSVYGNDAVAPNKEGCEGTLQSPYALSKNMMEELAALHARRFGTRSVGLRFFNVYGPRQAPNGAYAAVIPNFFRARQWRRPLVIHGTGEQSRDFVHVSDVASALLGAVTIPVTSSCVYNVGTGVPTTVRELANLIVSLTSGTAEYQFAEVRPGEILESYADMTRFEEAFATIPRIPIAEGLRLSAAYYSG